MRLSCYMQLKKMVLTYLFLFISFVATLSSATEVVLLDTKNATSELRWTTFTNSEGMDDAGWLEETWRTKDTNENRRAYVVCNVDQPNVDNWLRTPWIERSAAARMHVEVTFTVRDCKQFPGKARSCKETFTLLAHEADSDSATPIKPLWKDSDWTRVDRIAADTGRFSDANEEAINVETRSFPVSKKGVYFAFRDGGACISILNVRVFFEQCVETVKHFAWFPQTSTGAGEHSIVETTGHCVANASPAGPASPKYLCKADGKWDLLDGACRCNQGFIASDKDQTCTACPTGTYKSNPGYGVCLPCPTNSNALADGNAECVCDAGYYRARKETNADRCSRPPTRPGHVRATDIDQTSVVIEWDEPMNLGGRTELWYRWECKMCPKDVRAVPADPRLTTRSLSLHGLKPSTQYSIIIYAENDISAVVEGLPQYEVIDLTTGKLSPLLVTDLRIGDVTDTSLTLAWNAPDVPVEYYETNNAALVREANRPSGPAVVGLQPNNDGPIKFYQIRYITRSVEVVEDTLTTAKTSHTFANLRPRTDYGFQVRAFTTTGWGGWSDTLWAQAGKGVIGVDPSGQSGAHRGLSPMWIVLALAGIVIVLLVLALVACMRKSGSRKQLSDLDHLDTYKQDNMTPDYNHLAFTGVPVHPTLGGRGKLTSPLMPAFNTMQRSLGSYGGRVGGYKPYVDPLAYEDPNQALIEFTNEIDANNVFIDEVIGGGEFGEVCKGKLRGLPGRRGDDHMVVAIKTLKPGSSVKAKSDFLTEASIMGQFDHPNVIRLMGVVTRSEPVMIITEYMENHSLDNFLRINDGRLDLTQIVGILRGIAAGMKYLSEKGYVHRDLAARNVLVDNHLNCKIADFGLSRGLEGSVEQEYTTNGGKIPVRWTAPEAITHRKFTTASDVWSFGVVMWEVCSFGERPYWEWTNQKVISEIQQGFRLPAPMDTPPALHQLMLQCWSIDRHSRPTFSQILRILESYIHCPELIYGTSESLNSSLITPYNVTQHSADCSAPVPPPASSMPSVVPLEDFFRQIGLSHCYAKLSQSGVRTMDALCRLNTVDFHSYGLTSEETMLVREALCRLGPATLQRRSPASAFHHPTLATLPSSRRHGDSNHNDGFFV